MLKAALAAALIGTAFSQLESPHVTPGKMAFDMNVECVSLLGKNLYAKPESTGADVKALERHLAEADKHVAAQPENPVVHVERAQALEALWRFHEAVQAYSKAIALNPGDPNVYVARGRGFATLRLFEQSAADFEHATAIDPQNADAWLGLGVTNYLRGNFSKAADALQKARALPLNQRAEETNLWYSLALIRQGKSTEAPIQKPGSVASKYGLGEYAAALESGTDAALPAYRAMIAKRTDWPTLEVLAAEAEVAAVDGNKKMSNERY